MAAFRGALSLRAAALLVLAALGTGAAARADSPSDPVIIAAGDIASCSYRFDADSTARIVDGIPGTVLTLGDNAYPNGSAEDFANCYDPTWGRFKSRTMPAVGNHEYLTPDASAYFDYFGAAAGQPGEGWYSFDLGAWHLIALNSDCFAVGCQAKSPQWRWLRVDLATHENTCTLAFFHHPLFSSGSEGGSPEMLPLWQLLYQYRSDVVLAGHDHDYERFAPQAPDGTADPQNGIREFVVGTGGGSLLPMGPILPNEEIRNNTVHGVLRLDLHPASYDWTFIAGARASTFSDSGSGACSPYPAEVNASTPPSGQPAQPKPPLARLGTGPVSVHSTASGFVARLALTIRRPGNVSANVSGDGRSAMLQRGSAIGALVLKRSVRQITVAVKPRQTIKVVLRFDRRSLRVGVRYELLIVMRSTADTAAYQLRLPLRIVLTGRQ